MQDLNEFGIDLEGEHTESDSSLAVEIPEISNPLCDADFLELQQTIDPLQHDDAYGIDVYISVCAFVNARI